MELQDPTELTPEQVQMIKDHLQLVFTKVTPDVTKPNVPTPAGPIVLDDNTLKKIEELNTRTICSSERFC